LISSGCKDKTGPTSTSEQTTITDAVGRKVTLPKSPKNIITMRAGAVRMMAYMLATDHIGYIEANDTKRVVSYMMAHPELKDLPVIGAGNNYDPEAVATSDADLVIVSNMDKEEADAFSTKVQKPVVCLKNGDLHAFKSDFYSSLEVLGQIFQKSQRADSLINYIEDNFKQIQKRIDQVESKKISAYVGGIAYNGLQGITSTRAQYPPFVNLKVNAPVDDLPQSLESIGVSQKNLMIDVEQIIEWDVDYMFMDISGQPLWNGDISKPIFRNLKCVKNDHIFTVLPYNWNSVNYENVLCNMWFVGKTIYPSQFADVDINAQCKEIISFFYQKDIYDQVMQTVVYTNKKDSKIQDESLFKPYSKVMLHDQ
jgi:iron complex transport system substrate-binding protein